MTHSGGARLSRREMLRLSAAGVLAGSASGWFDCLARDAAAAPGHRSCILLWMEGGPSQQHTFDLKDGGPYRAIPTAVPGVRVSDAETQGRHRGGRAAASTGRRGRVSRRGSRRRRR